MDKKENNLMPEKIDLKSKVMGKIVKEKIEMRHPLIFLAQKLGMQSVLVLVLIMGALLIDIGFYLLKKTGSFQFLSLGAPGRHIFIKSFPFDYLALFLITLIVANYLLKKLDLSRGLFLFANAPIIFLFVLAMLTGLFFAKMGAGEIMKDWKLDRMLPKETAAQGEVIAISKKEVTIRMKNGQTERVVFNKDSDFPYSFDQAKGKFLRATGFLDAKNPEIFHAEQIRCCDAE